MFLQDGKLRDRQTIENAVAEIFSQKLHVEVCSYDSDLFETGILDSLQLVELLFQLEQQFGVRISLDEIELENFRSIERITVVIVGQEGKGFGDDTFPSRRGTKNQRSTG
jgi:methoxymalonate biosynthesis acyl carrier protein